MAEPLRWCIHELTLSEMLSDPIVRALMEADGVEASELEAALRIVAATRAPPPPARTAH